VEALPLIATVGPSGAEKELHFMPLTVGQYIRLFRIGEHGSLMACLSMMCRNYSDEEAREVLFNISGSDDIFIMKKIDDILDHGMKPVQSVCQFCGRMNNVSVDGGDVLISPFREPGVSDKHKIRYGS
jgi:hypothetical protein